MEFAREYLVHYYEADCSRHLTLTALVQYLEDIAILHSTGRGLDLDYYDANHCGWMLLKWDIRINARPVFGDTVRIDTKVHALKTFQADREFTVTAADGSVLATARSNWLLVDTIRRRPIKLPAEQYEKFNVTADSGRDYIAIDDVPAIADGEASVGAGEPRRYRSAIRTTNSDIDTNNHVNNVRYLNWAVDSLPSDFVGRRYPCRLLAQYKKELGAQSSADVVSLLSPEGSRTRHSVRAGTDEYCSLEIEWRSSTGSENGVL